MAKNGTCELCGLPDNSYSIESDGKVFKVCKLCYDGFIDKHGSDSADITDDELAALAAMPAPPAAAQRSLLARNAVARPNGKAAYAD